MADTIKLVTVYKVATANIRDVLFEGEVGNFNGSSSNLEISLSNSYKEYDILGFYARVNHGGAYRYIYREIPTEQIDDLRNINHSTTDEIGFCWGYASTDDYCQLNKLTNDTELSVGINKMLVYKVVGIKYVSVGTLIDNKG